MNKYLKRIYLFIAVVIILSSCTRISTITPVFTRPTLDHRAATTPVPQATELEMPTEIPPAPALPTIDVWYIQGEGGGQRYMQDSIDRFKADHPGINVTASLLLNDPYKVAIKNALDNGNPPCIFPTWGGGPMKEFIQAGQIVDLTEMMSKDNYQDRFLSAAISNVTYNGEIWGVPVENTAVAVIFYNKAIFEQYGLTPPKSYAELLVIIDQLNAAGIAPFALANKTKWPGLMYYMYLVDRLGGMEAFTSAADRQGGSFQDPAFIRAGEMVQDLVKRNAFVDGFNELNHDDGESRTLLYSGKAAMELMGTWNIPLIKEEDPYFYEHNLGFFPFPSIDGGIGDPSDLMGIVGDQFYHVAAACKYPQEAFELIQYFIDDQAAAERGSFGRIPPVRSFTTSDPFLHQVNVLVSQAHHIQSWYDQYLPSAAGEAFKNVVQQLFGLTISPGEAGSYMEEAISSPPPYLGGSKPHYVMREGELTPGYDMGVDTSRGHTNWAVSDQGEMCMVYPEGQSWGAAFITFGKPTAPPRLGADFSMYQMLQLELRGEGQNETVLIGVKDNTSPDDGSEKKFRVANLTTGWTTVVIPLSEFKGINLRRLYVVTEFVFEETAETVCVRDIQYIP